MKKDISSLEEGNVDTLVFIGGVNKRNDGRVTINRGMLLNPDFYKLAAY